MGKRDFMQKKLGEIGVFATAQAQSYGFLTDVQKFQWGSTSSLEAQDGGFGTDGPSDYTSAYQGGTLTLELKEENSIDKLLAYLQRQTVATFTGYDPRLKTPAFFWMNMKDPVTGKRTRSAFIWGAMLQGEGQDIGAQPGAQQFQFNATMARRFKSAIQVDAFTGNAAPVTSLPPTKTTMLAWKDLGVDKYVLQILRYSPTTGISLLSKDAGEYTETATTVTLTTGLGTGELAVMAYLFNEP